MSENVQMMKTALLHLTRRAQLGQIHVQQAQLVQQLKALRRTLAQQDAVELFPDALRGA